MTRLKQGLLNGKPWEASPAVAWPFSSLRTDSRPTINRAIHSVFQHFANPVAAARAGSRYLGTHIAVAGTPRVAAIDRTIAAAGTAAEQGLAFLHTVAIVGTSQTIFTVSRIAHAVAARGSRRRDTVVRAPVAVFVELSNAVVVAHAYGVSAPVGSRASSQPARSRSQTVRAPRCARWADAPPPRVHTRHGGVDALLGSHAHSRRDGRHS